MQIIDTRGHLCPAPLIMTKRALKNADDGEQFTIIADNNTASCNLMTFLDEMGYKAIKTEKGGEFHIVFSKNGEPVNIEPTCEAKPANGGYIVVLKSETMGSGSDDLGAILMRGCINSLGEVDHQPKALIMYNAGVLLATIGKDTALSLEKLALQGVQIIACGACVDYYGIKSELTPCITIGNMLKINSMLSDASSVIYP